MKDKPRDGFMSLTYTRASSNSLKRRLNRLSSELTPNPQANSSSKTKHRELPFITELCVDLTRSDVICYLPALTDALEVGNKSTNYHSYFYSIADYYSRAIQVDISS